MFSQRASHPALLLLQVFNQTSVVNVCFCNLQQQIIGCFNYDTFAVQGEERPHVVKRSTQKCESTFDKYCLNNGLCMLLVDINEHHCKCEDGFYGPRCGNLELVFQPMAEEQILLTVFCVILLMIGLAGALYFCCKCIYVYNKYTIVALQSQQQ
uniref:EGF-like domain-containing protein n=1 Tax=Labrus bergylta TaxID=56723 RepID=A0A3Q3GBN0_9LABR